MVMGWASAGDFCSDASEAGLWYLAVQISLLLLTFMKKKKNKVSCLTF